MGIDDCYTKVDYEALQIQFEMRDLMSNIESLTSDLIVIELKKLMEKGKDIFIAENIKIDNIIKNSRNLTREQLIEKLKEVFNKIFKERGTKSKEVREELSKVKISVGNLEEKERNVFHVLKVFLKNIDPENNEQMTFLRNKILEFKAKETNKEVLDKLDKLDKLLLNVHVGDDILFAQNLREIFSIINISVGKQNSIVENDIIEGQIIRQLGDVKHVGMKIARENLIEGNALYAMSQAGSKGNDSNTSQITGIIGQQFTYGKRFTKTMNEGLRALPYFALDDLSPESRGFVPYNFLSGLSLESTIFLASAGREGILDTATKTPEGGKVTRHLQNTFSSFRTHTDGSVRNSLDYIFMFQYGDHGLDPKEQQNVEIDRIQFTSFFDEKTLISRLHLQYEI